ncbi:hypothetical protein D3C73_1537570 [compost metagenome]
MVRLERIQSPHVGGFSTRTTSPGLQKTLVATSCADWDPAVITTFSGRASVIPLGGHDLANLGAQFFGSLAAAVLEGGHALLGDDLRRRLSELL